MTPVTQTGNDSQEIRTTFRSWLAVFSVALGAFAVVTSEFLPIGLLNEIVGGLKISAGYAGLMVTIPGLVAAVAAPVMAVAAGHLDRRTVVLALMILLVGSNLTSALAPNFAVMLVGRVLFGITLGGFWTIAVTLGARLVAPDAMGRATTIILAGISVATVAGVPAGTLIASLADWRLAFGAVGGLAVITIVAQLFVLPRLPSRQALSFIELTHLLRNADARVGLSTIAFVIAGHFAAYTYVAPFLRDKAHIGPSALSSMLLVYGVAGIIGNFVGGAAAARRLRLTLAVVVMLLSASILLLPVVGIYPAGAALLLATWGLAFGAMPITLNLWVFKSAPDAMEGGSALLVATFQIFIAIGSVVGGRIVDNFGTAAVMLSAGAVIGSTLLIVGLSRGSAAQAKSDIDRELPVPELDI